MAYPKTTGKRIEDRRQRSEIRGQMSEDRRARKRWISNTRPPRKPARLPRAREADGRERCGQVRRMKKTEDGRQRSGVRI